MGDHKKTGTKSRRSFLLLFTAENKKAKPGMVKMLTADGKIVEIEKSVLEAASTKQKATNKEIYNWMQNPSKENK